MSFSAFSYLLLFMHTFTCTSCSLYTHAHHGRVLTTLDLHVQILDVCSIVQVFDETVRLARNWTLFLLILVFTSLLYSCYFLILSLSHSAVIFPSVIHLLSLFRLYMYYCSDHWLLWFRFIACSGWFRLSVYAWGIFLAYIRRRLSSRLRSSVFWEAGRDTCKETSCMINFIKS